MSKQKKTSYLFNVEILVEDEHHSTALEQLLRKLNEGQFVDYTIQSGVELGNVIKKRKESSTGSTPIPIDAEAIRQSLQPSINTAHAPELQLGLAAMKKCKAQNKLIRLIVNKGLGVKLSIPCRVINVDEKDLIVTVYHVDEKQVYTFRLSEIEDFIET